jgi:alkylation response protein AidB-like acyl-CoA dehydrogenase
VCIPGFVERLGLSAVHVHEEFGGQGAESVATCIVIEEVARVCASRRRR